MNGVLGTIYKEMLAANPELAEEGDEPKKEEVDEEPAPEASETKE